MPKLAQGQVWWVNLPAPAGRRPAVVLTRNSALAQLGNVTIAPLTRTRRGIPAEVELTPADGVPTDCVITLENILTVPQRMVDRRIAMLGPTKMLAVFDAIRYVFEMR
ncbi:MAG TPA: type II toxin-antitoxin system PemK/MazF family toxin [Tepidisphaeraceae bacterium]|jgi:mRNA interferase MazF